MPAAGASSEPAAGARISRGVRGGVASRMTGSQKRAARKEREALVPSGILKDDEEEEEEEE